MAPLLKVVELSHNFGGLCAWWIFSSPCRRGNLWASSVPTRRQDHHLNLITGVFRVSQGRVFFMSRTSRVGVHLHHPAGGIARTFQNIRLFKDLGRPWTSPSGGLPARTAIPCGRVWPGSDLSGGGGPLASDVPMNCWPALISNSTPTPSARHLAHSGEQRRWKWPGPLSAAPASPSGRTPRQA